MDRLRKARERHKYTLRAVAQKLEVSPQTILNYEVGHTRPSPERFARLKEVLELDGDFEDYFPPRENYQYSGEQCFECHRPARAKGLCQLHYLRYWRTDQAIAAEAEKEMQGKRRRK
jgi:transcriptional regulator with XRE-family HTH domain